MEEMASSWSYQESIDELKLKIQQKALELEAVKAISNEEMNLNTDSLEQLLQLLKLVRHERDEARNQIQKLLINITPSTINRTKPNSVDSLFNPASSPDQFSNINTKNSFVQKYYRHELMLSYNGFQALGSIPEIDHDTLMMDSMIEGKALPQKGSLLQAVMEAGSLLQTLLVATPINLSSLQSFSIPPVSHRSSSPVTVGGGGGGSILCFDDVDFIHYQGRMELVAKRQRFR